MIRYKSGKRFVLHDPYSIQTTIVGYDLFGEFFALSRDGVLHFSPGYSWNGAGTNLIQSFILTRKKTIRPSMVHDALCELLEAGLLPQHEKALVDLTYYTVCYENKVSKIRASLYLGFLLNLGNYSVRKEVIEEAP